jgi:hypothetical protein
MKALGFERFGAAPVRSDSRHYREEPPSSLFRIACQSFRRGIPSVPLFAEASW